jgi:O-antigen/teichoic acid export membrane protein
MLGTIVAQGATVLFSPVMTRLYSPSDLGRLALFTSVIGIAAVAGSLRYETAIVSATTRDEAAHLVALSAALLVPMGLVTALVAFVAAQTGMLNLSRALALLVLPGVLLMGGFNILKFWSLRIEEYREVSRATASQSVGRVAAQALLGLVSSGASGLIIGDIFGRCLGMGRMLGNALRTLPDLVTPFDLSRFSEVARVYRKFPLLALPSSLINSMAVLLPAPIIAHHYGMEVAGWFSLAFTVVSGPLIVIGNSIGDAFHARLAVYAREQPERSLRFLLLVAGALFVVGLPPIILLSQTGELVFERIFGPEWTTAGAIAAALAPWALTQFTVAPLSRAVYVFQGQELKLIYDFFSLAIVVSFPNLASRFEMNMVEAIGLLSALQALSYLVYFVLLCFTIHRWLADE